MRSADEPQAFLGGFRDAEAGVAFNDPSVTYSNDPKSYAAWFAGRTHFRTLVDTEYQRLRSGDNFPEW